MKRLTRRESQDLTRLKLLEAAERVFVRSGFDAASVEQISEQAGFSRGAFYSNFPDKDAIFLEILERKHDQRRQTLDDIFRANTDPARRFAAVQDWYVSQCELREWTILRTEFSLRAARNRGTRQRLRALFEEELKAYSALIEQYFSEAGVKPAAPPRTLALALRATFEGLGTLTATGAEIDAEDCHRYVFERLLGGAGFQPAAELSAPPKTSDKNK